MTRTDYFLAWPHAQVAKLAADQEAQIKELQEIITVYREHADVAHAQRRLALNAWRKEVGK